MGRMRLGLVFIAAYCVSGLQIKGESIALSSDAISHKLVGSSRSIEKTESWLTNNGVLTTVITLKPKEQNAESMNVEVAGDFVPESMQKDIVQDRFWNALKERLSIDKTAKLNLSSDKKIIVASNKPVPVPEPHLPTDQIKPEELLSPQEKNELESFNQSFVSQPRSQQVPLSGQDHAMTLAMQMQMSAQALSNQATMLMMQNNRNSYAPVNYQAMPGMQMAYAQPAPQVSQVFQQNSMSHESTSVALPRQEKMSRLMGMLNQIMFSGIYSMQRLLVLIDLEIEIIERLLAGETGSRLEKIVEERNKTLTQSSPIISSCYDLIVDLATTDAHGESDSRLYHYFVRSGKKQKITQSSKKKFLLAMMYAMKHYQEMIESMYNLSRTTLPTR